MLQLNITPQSPHVIIQGRSRTGKTYIAEKIVNDTPEAEVKWLDVKRVKSRKYPLTLKDLLDEIENEIRVRLKILEENEIPNIDELKENKKEKLIVAIDDFDYLISNLNPVEREKKINRLYNLLRISPSVGIHFIITTQIQPWNLIPKYKDLIFITVNTKYNASKNEYSFTINKY